MQLFIGGSVFSQNLPGGFQHVIEVGCYSDWNNGYLTITDNNTIMVFNGDNAGPYPITYNKTDSSDRFPGLGDMLLEVDGISAAGWGKEDFYKVVDGRHDTITLKLRSREKGQSDEYVTRIVPRYELPDKLKQFGLYTSYVYMKRETPSNASKRKTSLKDVSFEERHDKDFDFSKCYTYDYLITSNDPLLDKEILDDFMKFKGFGMTRDENNPDLLITISRNVNETINSTYIPPSSRTVNTGSTTTARYNYITKTNDYITTQNNRTIQEGGYVKETKTTDIFLEIAALDAKRINDPNLTYPPIVWKATATRHVLNPSSNFNNTTELKAYASWMYIPPTDRLLSKRQIWCTDDGIYSAKNSFIIKSIDPYSLAESAGLEPGDKILRVINGNYSPKTLTKINKKIRKDGWGGVSYYMSDMDIMVLRSGKRIVIHVPPVQKLDFWRFWWEGAE